MRDSEIDSYPLNEEEICRNPSAQNQEVKIVIRKIKDSIIFFETLFARLYLWFKHVEIGHNCLIKGKLFIINKGQFHIGNNVRINSRMSANPIGGDFRCNFVVKENAQLLIGNNVAISNCAITCSSKIILENYVMIGGGVKVYDTDFHPISLQHRLDSFMHYNNTRRDRILISYGAFIGAHAIILKGVTIGRNAVVGAGSVVSKNIPDYEIWAGNPAKFIGKVNEPE